MLTAELLGRIMPNAHARIATYLPPLTAGCDEFDINSPRRLAAFLAQVAHESGELQFVLERASGVAYEGRVDLGNVQQGDGARYKGRGLLQATGRLMYTKLTHALNLDLIAHPELLEEPAPAARSACYIWSIEKRLNPLADAELFGSITHKIQGGYLGIDSRITYWRRAHKALNL